MRAYVAAYRNQHDQICPVGPSTTSADQAACTARDAHLLEPEVRFFVAFDENLTLVGPWNWQELL
jgi:hypothetical protein